MRDRRSLLNFAILIVVAAITAGFLLDKASEAVAEIDALNTYPAFSDRQKAAVDTSDWKTYRNEQYGFEVRYPSELDTEFRLYDNHGFQLLFNASAEKSVIAIELVDVRSTGFLKFVESQKESVKQSKIVVDGITADFYEGLREFTAYNAVTILRGNDLIIVYQYSAAKPLFNQILSTFKFIK